MSSSVFVLLLVLCSVSLCAGACVLSSDKLSGSNFEISRDDANACDAPAIRQPGGAWLNAAQIVVVANTTVTFNITSTTPTFLFGLTSNVSSNNVGSAVGLTISADSLAAGSCRAYPETDVNLNTFTRNYSDAFVLVPQTCVLTWKVPVPTNNTQYYYFIGNSNPVLINIVNSTDGPTGSSGSTTIPPTPTATPTGNTTATPTPTATPTGNTTATPTPTAKPTGNNTATPTPGGATTQPPTPTATPTPKTNATLAPTVTPNTGAATAGHVNAALRGVVGAFICAMLSAL